MAWTPPQIDPADFTDVEDESHKPPRQSSVARAAYDLAKWAQFNNTVVSVLELSLRWNNRAWDTSYADRAHAAITATGDARLKYRLGSGPITIGWKLRKPRAITRLLIEVFKKRAPAPVWTRTETWDEGACPETGACAFDPGAVGGWAPDEREAYKVRVTIPPGNYLRREHVRWAYFDVAPKTWIKVIAKQKEPESLLEHVTLGLTLPDRNDADETTNDQGLVHLVHYQPDGNYVVRQLVSRDEDGLLEIEDAVETT